MYAVFFSFCVLGMSILFCFLGAWFVCFVCIVCALRFVCLIY